MTNQNAPEELLNSNSDTFKLRVAGVSHRQTEVRQVEAGNTVTLEQEPNNPYDRNAIKVIAGSHWIGYVSRQDAKLINQAIKSGCTITGEVEGSGKPNGSDAIGVLISIDVKYPS